MAPRTTKGKGRKPSKKADPRKEACDDLNIEGLGSYVMMITGSQRAAIATMRIWADGKPIIRRKGTPRKRPETETERWNAYKEEVWRLTRINPLELLPNYDKRGFHDWHIDHVLSIREAYDRNLPPDVPACMSNLRMMPAKANLLKHTRTVFTNLFNE